MPLRALTMTEVARELGRSTSWLRREWPRLIKEQGFPQPLLVKGGPVWSAPHVYAWLDRDLAPALRLHAAAHRAALEAAASAPLADDEEQAWRDHHLNHLVKEPT